MSDRAWLAEYADTKSAAAFARLVREHGPLVYSTCLREVRDRHLAEDVAQVVFLLLARKLQAGSWRPRTVLAGWLYETARFASRNALRRERRRRARETKAVIDMLGSRAAATGREGAGGSPRWEEIEPLLHKALGRLRPKDRDAILLRYYQDKPLKVVGASLGISADAAQARVARVLEKLRQSLSRSGVVVSVATFAELLRANAEAPVPSGLVEGVVEALAHRAGTSAGGTVVVASRVDLLTDGVARAMVLLAVQKIVAVVACATVLASAVVAANRDERDPAALALLEKFGEGQAKLQSFIVRSEDTSHWAGGVTEAPPVTSTGQSVNEFRADARTGRFARRSAHRGDARPDATLDAGADGDYTSTVWDGRALYAYSRSDPGTPDRLTIVRGPYDGDAAPLERLEREVRTGYAGAATMGYFHLDEVRIDRAAKRASYIRLRPDREAVNGVDCQVIEMCTDGGNYTLWIDPEHGFHIVRAHVMKLPGDVVSGRKLEKGCRIRHVVEITRFEQVDGVWVPMEAKEEVDRIFPASPTPAQRGSMTHKKTLVKLNPDFDASGAFKLDDVRDGTLVSESAPGGTVKRAVWKGGVLEPLSF